MTTGWRYRVGSVTGVVVLTALAVALVNSPTVQRLVVTLPVLRRLSTEPPTAVEGLFEILVTTAVLAAAFVPLYKPRPRRILDTASLASKRVVVAMFALAAIGYFDYTYRLPRLTLLSVTPVLLGVLPAWFVWIRQRPTNDPDRAIIVGDSPGEIERLADAVDPLARAASWKWFQPNVSRIRLLFDGGSVLD